jgi:trehalose synthase
VGPDTERPRVSPCGVREVEVAPISLDRLESVLVPGRREALAEAAARGRALLAGRRVWNVNSTASGGGVAEMLQALLAYSRGAGVDTRWLVLEGNPEFFAVTKRVHNLLHGSPGDGGPTGAAETATYERTLARQVPELTRTISPGDIVLLHDPQTAGLAAELGAHGAHVVWRSHVGADVHNDETRRGWAFLRPYLGETRATIFTRRAYVPDWVDPDSVWLIPPSLDPLSSKNRPLRLVDVIGTLRHLRIVSFPAGADGSLEFSRRDGSPGTVRPHPGLTVTGGPVPADARVVLQVSRWDRLKDMGGVLTGFADHLARFPEDVHLLLVGPDSGGVSDDPESAEVLTECEEIWSSRPESERQRLHLCSLPMDDVDENAHVVNALQRHASLVVQKSLVEGFGLTVAEPMWKGRPVVASRVGGIQDQIVDGESGLLLDDPADVDGCMRLVRDVLMDAELAARLGAAAHERARDHFLGDRHLRQYVELFEALLTTSTPVSAS